MTKDSERLVAYGFVKSNFDRDNPTIVFAGKRIKIEGDNGKAKLDFIKKKRKELKEENLDKAFDSALQDAANHEWLEVTKNQLLMTDYPKSQDPEIGNQVYRINLESWHQSIEPYYYWCMNFFSDVGFPIIDKISDIFTAAEHSSFYGAAGQRLGLAQDKVGQYLATIGKMIKDLFQLVREMRWIDERLEIYRDAFGVDKEGKPLMKDGKDVGPKKGAEVALKGLWVDLVDGVVGGQRTGSNLFLMAQQLQFTVLPDLFFSVHPLNKDDIESEVQKQAGAVNQQVKQVLIRKLEQYLSWKKATFDEMKSRRIFTLDYLRQHYQVIRLYMTWIRPYIKHIERLSGEENLLQNPRLVAAFESSLVEIEVLARMVIPGKKDTYVCVLLTFEYHTKPSMQYPGDTGYHRGPIHVGTTQITWRSYAWTSKQINNYILMRTMQDLDILSSVDKSLDAAMSQLGTDIETYLQEAESGKKEKPEEKKPTYDLLEPFAAVGKGLKEAFGAVIPTLPSTKKKEKGEEADKAAKELARRLCFLHYNVFKKAHGLCSW